MTTNRSCPRCQELRLIQTGAFWSCGNCGYAITHAALCVESDSEPTGDHHTLQVGTQKHPLDEQEAGVS